MSFMVHKLKIDKVYLKRLLSGQKTFEIRKNDRDYQVNDIMAFDSFTAHHYFRITYKSTFEQKDGYCVLSVVELHDEDLKNITEGTKQNGS